MPFFKWPTDYLRNYWTDFKKPRWVLFIDMSCMTCYHNKAKKYKFNILLTQKQRENRSFFQWSFQTPAAFLFYLIFFKMW